MTSPLTKRREHDEIALASQEASVCISTVEVEIHAPMEAELAVAKESVSVEDALILGASASSEASVAVVDTATLLKLESGTLNAPGAASVRPLPEMAEYQAPKVAPVVNKAASTSVVNSPKPGTNETGKVLASERKKKETSASNKPPKVTKTSVPTPEEYTKSGKSRRKLKLQKSSIK